MSATRDELIAAITAEFASFGGTGGVAAKHLGTGEEIRVNADVQTGTASTIKVPILIELFRQVEFGKHSLLDRMTVGTMTPGSGILRDLTSGIQLSIRDVAVLMIVVSDNTATNMLIDLLGLDRINQTMAQAGFPGTRLVNRLDFPKIGPDVKNLAVTTPGELAGIMEELAKGTILSRESCRQIIEIMQMQHHRDLTPRYLPFNPYAEELGIPDNGLRIANKTGGWTSFRADMALIEWPGTQYSIGIVTEADPDTRFWSENNGDKTIGRISRLIFEYWDGASL